MLIVEIIIVIFALIGMVMMFIEGMILILSKNQIRRGLYYVGGAIILALLAGLAGLSALSIDT